MQILQARAAEWVEKMFGREVLMNTHERAKRVLEEALELAQAEGVTIAEVNTIAKHVFDRAYGPPILEGTQVGFTLLAWAHARGVDLELLIRSELTDTSRPERMEAIKRKVAMKNAKGLTIAKPDNA